VPARVGQGAPLDQPLVDDVVEEVLRRQVERRQVGRARERRAGRLVGGAERALGVVEHPWPHVRRRHDLVEADRPQRGEQREAVRERPGPVVDAGDPVAVEVDEAAHRGNVSKLGRAPPA